MSFQSADKMSIQLNWDVIVLGYLWEDMVGYEDVIFVMCQDMKSIWTHLEVEIGFFMLKLPSKCSKCSISTLNIVLIFISEMMNLQAENDLNVRVNTHLDPIWGNSKLNILEFWVFER
jgi:hypothetical protein